MSSSPEKLTVDLSQCSPLPKSVKELLRCPQIDQYVEAYNARMREEFEDWEDLPKAALMEDAEMARDVEALWNEETIFNNTTRADIQKLSDLIHAEVEKVKEADIDRILHESELQERLEEQGIDFNKLQSDCEEMYQRKGYVKILRKKGLLGEKEKYVLPTAKITEAQMQRLEVAMITDEIDTLFFDDQRLNATETASALGITIKKGKELLSASVSPNADDNPQVRLLGFKASRQVPELHPGHTFKKIVNGSKDMEPIDAATNMRIGKYLALQNKELRKEFHFYVSRGLHQTDDVPVEVTVNQTTPDGKMLTMTVSTLDWGVQQYDIGTIRSHEKKKRTMPIMAFSFPTETE